MNPFLSNQPLDPGQKAILARQDVFDDVFSRICAGEFCFILGPKHSGRTTLLKAVKARLRTKHGELPVLVSPNNLDLTGEREFFNTLAALLERVLRTEKAWPNVQELQKYKILKNADAFNIFLDDLLRLVDRRLVLLFDSIECIPPHLLVRVANIAHAVFVTRTEKAFLRNISFNFAGAISLRYLTFSLKPEVSPFNICSSLPLRDLTTSQARDFLERINECFHLGYRPDGLEAIVKFVDGDLNMLQRVAGWALEVSPPGGVDGPTVHKVIDAIIELDANVSEESLRSALRRAEEDAQVLDLVLELLNKNRCAYRPSEADTALDSAFEITYPEMTGTLVLERPRGVPTSWRFRSKLTEMFLRRHFTPQHIVKTYVELGQLDAAVRNCGPLIDSIRADFENNIVRFNDDYLKDVLLAFTRRILTEDSRECAYQLLAYLLKDGFGCPVFTYYDYVKFRNKLVAVAWLSPLFKNDGSEIDVDSVDGNDVLEVRAYRSQLFTVESKTDELRIAMPLTDQLGRVTAVITVHSRTSEQQWLHLDLKIHVMIRALQAINIALTKVGGNGKNGMVSLPQPLGNRGESTHIPVDSWQPLESKREPARIFVAHEFRNELLNNLRDSLKREEAEFRNVDKAKTFGLLSEAILSELRSCHLALYEMSKANNNVYFECGLGLGLNLPGILLVRVNTGSGRAPRIPPVLAGLLRLDYLNYTGMMEGITGSLKLALESYWNNQEDSDFIHFLGARLSERAKRVKYAAVLDHDHFSDQRDYRRVTDDVFKEAGLETVYPLDERVVVDRYLEKTAHRNTSHRLVNLISLLRNADMIVGRVENVKGSKEPHVAGQSFIGLGYAFGINETLKTRGRTIQMTLLSQDSRGKRLDAPADLQGYPFLRYANLPELRTRLTDVLALGNRLDSTCQE